MRVLVCGGRGYDDVKALGEALDGLHADRHFSVLIEGDARGADRLAGEWARRNGIENLKFPADWVTHGRAAGPIRNKLMLD